MTALGERLRARILRDGPIPVGEYMAAALGDPDGGYYACRDPFGASGDFVTAPEISQTFGELIGLWCAVTWRQAGAPTPVRLVELGPGRGTLMADLLRAAAADSAFVGAAEVHLVETSPVLRQRQRDKLAGRDIVWHDELAALPEGPLLAVANEFFDALPVDQYVRIEAGWSPIVVDVACGNGFVLHRSDEVADEGVVPPSMNSAPPGTICEVSPRRTAVAGQLAARVARDGGAALIVDYGPARSGPGATLQGVARHAFADVLAAPGATDLTAHVDFEALAAAGAGAGACVHGPVPQGLFLTRLGLPHRIARLIAAAPNAAAAGAIEAGGARLADPAAMGFLFKAMAFTHPALPTPAGFEPSAIEDNRPT